MVLGVLLAIAGIGILSALMFNAAVYALPVVVGIWTLQQVLAHGVGSIGAVILGLAAGATVYGAGHVALETSRSPALRLMVRLLFVVPAMIVGYSVALSLLRIGMDDTLWARLLAGVGGLVTGGSVALRLGTLVESGDRTAS